MVLFTIKWKFAKNSLISIPICILRIRLKSMPKIIYSNVGMILNLSFLDDKIIVKEAFILIKPKKKV